MTFRPEADQIGAMYDYLTAPAGPLPDSADVAFVFGRKSTHLATAAIEAADRSDFLVVSGNVGKDSGDLPQLGIPEADYVVRAVTQAGAIDPAYVRTDYEALNGRQNAENGVRIIQRGLGLMAVEGLITVAHSTQVRRLGATFDTAARGAGLAIGRLHMHKTAYPFNPENPFDQFEAASEMQRIDALSGGDHPALVRPADLPEDLLEYAGKVVKELGQEFKAKGIANPSTADNTDRTRSIMRTILFPPYPGRSPAVKLGLYARNMARAGALLLKER